MLFKNLHESHLIETFDRNTDDVSKRTREKDQLVYFKMYTVYTRI